ncbi:MAG: L-serine ammonia-lyase [Desulfobacterales bacterium]|nr:L-serine ammonia-lyase [Desulfobacterales bacterium]
MKSLKEIYRIGRGPSSSHTMGPAIGSDIFLQKNPDASSFRVTLYGSLAATGKGHLTDKAVIESFLPKQTEIIWKPDELLPEHPNGMLFEALSGDGKVAACRKVYSIGGGALKEEGKEVDVPDVYPLEKADEILAWSEDKGQPLWMYVRECEEDIWAYLEQVWKAMQDSIKKGLSAEGILPGSLKLGRKSRSFYFKARRNRQVFQRTGLLSSYALAVAEENAGGGTVVTAPTCGSCGIIPSVFKYLQEIFCIDDREILNALATAGLFGNLVKANASISGAEVGCQGEVGTACAMAAAAAAQIMGGTSQQIEYAAEMGMEHHIGLTCDPIDGLVQIPCIERNAMAATRAIDCADYALLTDGTHRVTFDEVVITMKQTGYDLSPSYKETSKGGLALFARSKK